MNKKLERELVSMLLDAPDDPEVNIRCASLTDEQRRDLKFAYLRACLTRLHLWLKGARCGKCHPDNLAFLDLFTCHARIAARNTGRQYNLLREAFPKYKIELKLKHARETKI